MSPITERRGGPNRSCPRCFEWVEVHPRYRFPGKFTLSITRSFHSLKLGYTDRKSLFNAVPCTRQHPRLDVFTRSHQIFICRSSEGHRNGAPYFISIFSWVWPEFNIPVRLRFAREMDPPYRRRDQWFDRLLGQVHCEASQKCVVNTVVATLARVCEYSFLSHLFNQDNSEPVKKKHR